MKHTVLIVDDSLTVRMDLAEAFQAAGFEPALCGGLAAAREALSGGAVALVVLDVELPDGDGVAFLAELKSSPQTRALPVLLLSSKAEVDDRIKGMKTGADDYVGKPYDRVQVVSRARDLLHMTDAAEPGGARVKVLVIDDSATFREELKAALEASGYAVETANGGEEGLRSASSLRPEAVIVDGVMPGLDGVGVVRRIRLDAALRRTPCLLLTASADRAEELRALDAGADGFVRKSEDLTLVLARLSAVLRGAPQACGQDTSALLAPKRILAVDDSATYREQVAEELRQEGYDMVMASSGEAALELLAVQTVDCILLDLMMPGMSGQEACRRIRGEPRWRETPLIMLTATGEREAMIEGINIGADDYITKSAEFDVLKARLRALLRRKQFEEENRRIRERLMNKELEAAEAQAARAVAEARAALTADLEAANRELEAFSYSVSHDLRAPLRHIDGFIELLGEKIKGKIDEQGLHYLTTISSSAKRMGELIDDLLSFSRMGREEMRKVKTDLGAVARKVIAERESEARGRDVKWTIAALPLVECDQAMIKLVFDNLIGNALKFTRKRKRAEIEIGLGPAAPGELAIFVRDNGAGFDMRYAEKLFGIFQRLHAQDEFEGTGIGLANIRRIVARHGGRTWAKGAVDAGAEFHFTLPSNRSEVPS